MYSAIKEENRGLIFIDLPFDFKHEFQKLLKALTKTTSS
nr:23S rRNA (adenine(2030)-N(6))-methyltransferase RlmJ [Rickettsia prowazekii]